uniref:MI domain-containing protein n=1 Tax=Spongospora subterranea TaxID=70186 RepID=A0A0H5R6G8_9EUKA|eukprot:CRZ09352.1 hypothetical protein [Spongospora subterranea]
MSLSATASAPPELFPLRPTSLLRARARVAGPSVPVAPTPVAQGRGYFQSLSSRKSYSIDDLLALRTKYALCPKDLPDVSCVESGADDTLTWGLRTSSPSSSHTSSSDPKRSKLKVKITKSMEGPMTSEQESESTVAPLPLSQNRWRPQASTGFANTIKKLKGILNKLTVDKFDQLSVQFINLVLSGCPTLVELREAVQLVFDKALDEMSFGDMYPNLVVLLSEKIPAIPADHAENQNKSMTFKSVMLSMCQSEFEKAYLAVLPTATPAAPTGPAAEMLRLKQRHRLLGNMKFIGELFNKNMLNLSVIIYCSRQLSAGLRSDHLEAVCTLLEVTGAALDATTVKTGQNQVREIFQRLTVISNMSPSSCELDSRTRFLVREILELRSSGWVPRRKKQEAMKIDDFRAKEEPFRQQMRDNLLQDDMVGVAARMPATFASRPVGSTRTPRYTDRYARAQAQATSPALSDSELARRYDTPSKKANGAAQPHTVPSSAPSKTVPAISEEKMTKGVQSLVREFLRIADIKEAMTCMEELSQAGNNTMRNVAVVSTSINEAMEANEQVVRANAASLICQLRKIQQISASDIEKSIQEVLQYLPDLVVDLPIAPKRFGEFLSVLVKDGSIPLQSVSPHSNPLTEQVFKIARS